MVKKAVFLFGMSFFDIIVIMHKNHTRARALPTPNISVFDAKRRTRIHSLLDSKRRPLNGTTDELKNKEQKKVPNPKRYKIPSQRIERCEGRTELMIKLIPIY